MIPKKLRDKWNKYFTSLTQKEQRIAIAQDVIASLQKGTYFSSIHGYVSLKLKNYDVYEQDFQSHMDEVKACNVCALGACFVSLIKYTDKLSIGSVSNAGKHTIYEALNPYFSDQQILAIEHVFEKWTPSYVRGVALARAIRPTTATTKLIESLISQYRYIEDRELRMATIMQNIVDNEGELKA